MPPRRSNFLASLKLASILVTVILAFTLAKYDPASIAVVVVPILAIVFLFVLHERTLRSLRRCARLLQAFVAHRSTPGS